jgi:hypothetical protein
MGDFENKKDLDELRESMIHDKDWDKLGEFGESSNEAHQGIVILIDHLKDLQKRVSDLERRVSSGHL